MCSTDSSHLRPTPPPPPIPPRPAARDDIGCVGCLGLLLVGVLSVPCLGLILLFGPHVWNDFWNSGSATSSAAIDRAAEYIGEIDGGRWKTAATNARAKWTAPDWSGDQITDVSFTLAGEELTRFERAVAAVAGPPERDESATSGWVYYGPAGQRGVRLGIHRRDGTVSFDHFN